MGLDLFKLEKLKIKAFLDAQRSRAATPAEFEATFNPASLRQSYGIKWSEQQAINSSGREAVYERSEPSNLDLNLVLDGTGVHEIGARKSVAEQLDELMAVAYRYNGEIHEPNYLLVEWGLLSFPCRLKNLDVTYSTFDRDGTPLRAELDVQLVADEEVGRRTRLDRKQSADLSHSRTVREGDSLPLLTREVYGSAARYLELARYNGLDDFRCLVPGTKILFPPLDRLTRKPR